MRTFKIGQVARQAGVTVDTIRFYERRGVLPRPARLESGYRVYTPDTVERLRLARSLQALGFTLDEVIDALCAVDQGGATCESERWRLEAVLGRIDKKLDDLRRVREGVVGGLAACRAGRCALLEEQGPLASHSQARKRRPPDRTLV